MISGEQYAERAEGNRLRTVVSEAPRGNIVDRNGVALVKNTTGENLVARPRELSGERRTQVLTRLAAKVGVPPAELIEKVDGGDDRPLESVVLAENIPMGISQYLAEHRRDFPGISLEKTYLRSYPEGPVAAHIVGSTGRIGPDEIADYRRRGYNGDETIGRGGIEQQYEELPARQARPLRGRGRRRRRAAGARVHLLARPAAGPQHRARRSTSTTQKALESGPRRRRAA